MLKLISCVLSVLLVFSSVTPSFAQITQSRRTPGNGFNLSRNNEFNRAVERQLSQALTQAQDRWWVEQGAQLVAKQCNGDTLPCILEDLYKAQQAAAQQDILQAIVCDGEGLNCVPALAYAWGGVHYAVEHVLYYQGKPIVETAPQLAQLITQYGVQGEEERKALRSYFYKVTVEAKTDCDSGFLSKAVGKREFEIGSQKRQVEARDANRVQAKRCTAEVSVLPALAMLEKTPYEKQLAAKEIYSLLKKLYDSEQGAEIIYSAVTALGVLGTEQAYHYLEYFITKDTIPSGIGNTWEGVWSPLKYSNQNHYKAVSKDGRYLNRINERFQYVDEAEAKRQGFSNTAWQHEERQYPYANILEEVGAFIGAQSTENAYAKRLADKIVKQANQYAKNGKQMAAEVHLPVVVGIIDGWRQLNRSMDIPSAELITLLYKGNWFDINEGTQRRIHQKAYEFGLRRNLVFDPPAKDPQKIQDYILYSRSNSMLEIMDVFASLLVVDGLFRVVPVLAKGIPTAVRTLRGRSAVLVGSKNYLQRIPKNTLAKLQAPAGKKVTITPNQAVKQPVAAQTTPAKTVSTMKVARVDGKTVQLLPEGYTVEQLNPGRTNIAPKTYASQGAPVANTSKVQPVMAQTTETVAAPAASNTAAAPKVTPKWIWGESTNALGQTVPSMVPNPAHPEYAQMLAAQSGKVSRPFSWKNLWTDMQLAWQLNKPNFSQLFKFGTSRYGLAGLGTGVAPVSSEAAIAQVVDAPAVVQTVRAQQRMFIAEDFLRGGPGASFRTGVANPGGIVSQQVATQMLGATAAKPTLAGMGYLTSRVLNPISPLVRNAAALVPAVGVAGGGLVYGSFIPISPRLFKRVGNWVVNWGRTSSSGMQAANKQAQSVLDKRQPMTAQLRDIVVGPAANTFKKQALAKLYQQGVFSSFLKKQPKAVRTTITEATTDWDRANALFTLYQAKYLDGVLKAIPTIQAQGSVLAQLQEVITQEEFADLARSAYEAEDVLPLQNENFAGAVSGVPEADLKKIGDTVRTEHYATENMSIGVTTAKGIYYDTNIPFYYRNSKGELSSEPVGILTQVSANLYGRILSKIHLASQPGLIIPDGFVLALDEQGQWKFFIPKGNLSVVENNAFSKKVLDGITKEGSARVILDTNYSTTDLLAMAHLLENNPTLNLELILNTPHSLSQFLTGHALFVGNDAGNTLTGPFKDSLKAVEGFVNTMTNLVSGVGYFTPIAGGYAMPTMSRWGNVKTTKVIYGMAAAALAGSLTLLGMNGTVDPSTLPLWALSIPTVALVLGASLANSFIPTFLNFYKDPAARTAANLDFSTKKQISRLSLSGIIAVAALAGLNWTVVVPVGLGLLGYSYALFLNTPMYKEEAARLAKENEAKEKEAVRWAALTPQEQAAEKKALDEQKALQKEIENQYIDEYEQFRNNQAEMKASKSRVKMVYASYAASLMVLGQSANEAFANGVGQGFITMCMAATLGTRLLATWLVKKNIMTDDQLTGLSLPTLALTGLALTLLPYSGIAAGAAGVAGILHYMATAVPGQLDAARMQNIVTAEMQQRKQNILDREDLTQIEKEAEVAKLTAEEKVWSAQASKDYSLYNSRGLWGIGIASAAAFLFADMGPQWTQDMLQWVSNFYDVSSPSLSLNRLLFLYSGSVASLLALKNLDLTADGLRFFGKKTAITSQAIADKKVTPKTFGINAKNAQIQLGNLTSKTMKELEPMLVEYGVSSEQKMTKILQQLQSVHNRLVAISKLLGPGAVRSAFLREATMVKKFGAILKQNDLSVMLNREFASLQDGLFKPGTQEVLAQPQYVEEGLYKLPENYQGYESARMVIAEMDQMAYSLSLEGHSVDYQKFVDYMTRAREDLILYERANPADAVRVGQLRQKIDRLGRWLLMQDKQYKMLNPLETDSEQIKKGKQALRDMLAAYEN